jgi:two-component system response regulator AtoC
VSTAEDGISGLKEIERGDCDVALLDLGLPGLDGLEMLARLQGRDGVAPIIVISARDDMRTTITAMQRGAWDYVVKPLDIERLRITVQRAIESREMSKRIDGLVETLARDFQVDNLVGRTPAMREVFKTIGMVSTNRATVLITGESGTGKELVARAIHFAGDSRDQPFVAVNCSAFPRELLESELFGHARGAFTGAVADKPGRFQLAGAGTLFLDEIGELPLDLQAKLLRVVQERTFERVGDPKPIALKARIVTATHRDLGAMVREATFREDLYYRLRVVEVRLPPLRERREDIPALAEHFLAHAPTTPRSPSKRLAAETVDALMHRAWPGNVRELQSAVHRAAAMAAGEVVLPADLPPVIDEATVSSATGAAPISLPHLWNQLLAHGVPTLDELELSFVRAVLRHLHDNKTQAAEALGVDRKTIRRILARGGDDED